MPLHKHQNLTNSVLKPIQKGLHIAQGAIEIGTLAKGIWDVGGKIVAGARALAPAAAGAAAVLL